MKLNTNGLAKSLDKLDAKIRTTLERSLKSIAEKAADRVQAESPVDTGKVRGSVKVRKGKPKKGRISYVVEITGNHTEDPDIDLQIEYGTRNESPNPFVRRAFDAIKNQAADQLCDDVKNAL